MGTRRIDGSVEAVWLRRRRAKLAVYDAILFRLADGSTKRIGKAIVPAQVAERLVPGTRGRFYLHNSIDHRGVHGVRDEAGGAVFGYPSVNETALTAVLGLNLAWIAYSAFALGEVPLLAAFVALVGAPLYLHYRGVRTAARRQFERDGAGRAGRASRRPEDVAERQP